MRDRSSARLVTALLELEASSARARAAAWQANLERGEDYLTRELRTQLATAQSALGVALEEASKETDR
jgi:hypothetical protein